MYHVLCSMYKHGWKYIFILILATCYFLHTTKIAHAQEVSLGVYPPILQIDATPPTSIQTPLAIQNISTDPIDVSIVLKPFTASSDSNGSVAYLPDGSNFGGEDPHIKDHIQLFEEDHVVTSLTLAPQQQKNLTLHIGLPEDEPPSDYYFSIVFISKNNTPDSGSASVSTGGIATNVLLSVGPKGKAYGYMKNFSSPLIIDHGPVTFSLLLHNDSQFFIVPKGTIIIKNMFGQTIGKLKLLPVNILSKTDRFVPDDASGSQTSLIWPEKSLFGPYSVTLTTALTDSGPLFTKTIYFFALPVQFFVGLFIAALLVGIIIIRVRKQLQKKKQH